MSCVEIDRKTIRGAKFKSELGGDCILTRKPLFYPLRIESHRRFEDANTLIERFVKCFFFVANRFFDRRLFRADFGKHVAHRFRDNIDKFEEERLVKAERAAVANRATQDATQNVTATFV